MLSTREPKFIDSIRPQKTPTQTLTRVRNNQRRHRERRRQYIASLEQKVKETELLLKQARTDIARLETDLAKFRINYNGTGMSSDNPHWLNDVPLSENQHQEQSSTGAHQAFSPRVPYALETPSKQSMSQPLVSDSSGENSSTLHNAQSVQHLDTQLYLLPGSLSPDYQPQVSPQCCSVNVDASDARNAFLAAQTRTTLAAQPEDRPLTAAYKDYPYPGEDSTSSCIQAYIVIAQQNFRGVSMEIIESSLYRGFRPAVTSGEGCRVVNRVLFELLDFISDT